MIFCCLLRKHELYKKLEIQLFKLSQFRFASRQQWQRHRIHWRWVQISSQTRCTDPTRVVFNNKKGWNCSLGRNLRMWKVNLYPTRTKILWSGKRKNWIGWVTKKLNFSLCLIYNYISQFLMVLMYLYCQRISFIPIRAQNL